MPRLSLPVRLALLVAGTTLPLIVFMAFIVFEDYKRDRADASERVLETTRSIRFVLDAEVQHMTSGLEVLALSDSLRTRDFDGFRRGATGFLNQYGEDAVLLVADREGRQVFSSSKPDTANLPPRKNRAMVTRVFTTMAPQYSSLFVGSTKSQPIVTVEVPVLIDGEVAYDISFSPPMQIFQSILDRQRPGDAWTISIFDNDGVNFARVPNPKETVGKPASPQLHASMLREAEATLQTVSLEGVPLFTTFSRSPLTGWTVATGIAEHSLVDPLWRNLAITSVLGTLLLLIGLAFAVRMATTIARGEMLHNLLIEELNHRVKNTLAILQAIAVQTFRSASKSEREKFAGRLGALAEAHNLLSEEKWRSSSSRGRDRPRAAALRPEQSGTDTDVGAAGAAVAAPCCHRFDDRSRDRHQRRQIRRTVERDRHGEARLGNHRGQRRTKTSMDLGRVRRSARLRAGKARLRIAPDRT